jgi:hypothetical protein|tara:strand:+ start:334 stop:507 length:174 start_codon:yes stop_codon:yes gene_type:complete
MMTNNYEARIMIPASMAPSLWKLAGGEDVFKLREGILAACELAVETTTGPTSHGPVV